MNGELRHVFTCPISSLPSQLRRNLERLPYTLVATKTSRYWCCSRCFRKPGPCHAAATPWKRPFWDRSCCDLIQSAHEEKVLSPGHLSETLSGQEEGKTSHRPRENMCQRHKIKDHYPKYRNHTSNSTMKGDGQGKEWARDVNGHLIVRDIDGN